MKKLYFLTILLLLTTANALAMDENQENYQTPRVVIANTGNPSSQHIAFARKISQRLEKVQNAIGNNNLETRFNTNINLNAAHNTFYLWLNLFNQGNDKEVSKEFVPQIRKLFVTFKETLDQDKSSENEDYPATHPHIFKLNLKIQKLVAKLSD